MRRSLPAAYAAFCVAVLLSACSTLGIPTPESFPERLAAGYVSVTAVRQTAITLLQSQKIGSDDAENINGQADNARAGLDIARTLQDVDPEAADARLNAVITAIDALRAYLESRQ